MVRPFQCKYFGVRALRKPQRTINGCRQARKKASWPGSISVHTSVVFPHSKEMPEARNSTLKTTSTAPVTNRSTIRSASRNSSLSHYHGPRIRETVVKSLAMTHRTKQYAGTKLPDLGDRNPYSANNRCTSSSPGFSSPSGHLQSRGTV
jgi:hypothetical protein